MYRMGQEEIDAVAKVIYSKKLFKVNDGENQEVANFEKEPQNLRSEVEKWIRAASKR